MRAAGGRAERAVEQVGVLEAAAVHEDRVELDVVVVGAQAFGRARARDDVVEVELVRADHDAVEPARGWKIIARSGRDNERQLHELRTSENTR